MLNENLRKNKLMTPMEKRVFICQQNGLSIKIVGCNGHMIILFLIAMQMYLHGRIFDIEKGRIAWANVAKAISKFEKVKNDSSSKGHRECKKNIRLKSGNC